MAVTFPTQVWRVVGPTVHNQVMTSRFWVVATPIVELVTSLKKPVKLIIAARRGYKLADDLVDTAASAYTGCPVITPEGSNQYQCVDIRIEIVHERTLPQAFDWIETWQLDTDVWVPVGATSTFTWPPT